MSSGMLNIGGENAGDAFYRYKMPKLQARIEGRGNGIKTNVVNCVEIARALERPPEYVLKFFGCELGAQTKFDKRSGTSIVNGAHDAGKLAEVLEAFIKKYVQCYACGNPETVVKLKREAISLKCKACGAVSEVDARLKLNTFILKNPPENKLSKAEKKVKKAEKERLGGEGPDDDEPEPGGGGEKKKKSKSKDKKSSKSKKGDAEAAESGDAGSGDAGAAAGSDAGDDDDGDDDGVAWLADTSEEAMAARAREQLSAATAAMVTQGNLEAEAEAAARRAARDAEAAAAAAAKLSLGGAPAAPASPDDALVAELRALVAAGEPPAAVAAALGGGAGGAGPAGRMRLLYAALFGALPEGERLGPAIAAAAPYLAPHAADAAGQVAQLVALEHLLGAGALAARGPREAPLALKALYDADLAEEAYVLAWARRADAGAALGVPLGAAAALRAAARPFVEWLEEASDDDDGDDDDDDDE